MGISLRDWRIANKKSQEWVADEVGVDQATISRAESSGLLRNLPLAIKLRNLTDGAVTVDMWSAEEEATPASPAPEGEPA